MIEIRWHGRGGQGAFTASKLLGNAAMLEGKYALGFPSFGPERRGAPMQAYTKIDGKKIVDRSAIKEADYIIYLDETLYTPAALETLKPGGRLFLNTAVPEKYAGEARIVAVDADRLSREILKRAVSNTAMLAALAADIGIVGTESIKQALSDFLPEKIAQKNKLLIEEVERSVQGQ